MVLSDRFVPSSLLLLVFVLPVAAQELHWRHDYNSARKESVDKNRPMLLDFVTDHCFWCKKLESTTFRDPAVARVLQQQFVLLKVDAERQTELTQMLKVQNFPTMIIASADGRILTIIEGFVEPAKLLPHLNKAATSGSGAAPEWMARDVRESEAAIQQGDFARAIGILRGVVEHKDEHVVKERARQTLAALEKRAASQLAAANAMQAKGQLLDAMDSFAEVSRKFAGVPAAAEAQAQLATLSNRPELKERQRTRRARELLAHAREEFRAQQYSSALEKCESLAANYPDLPEGSEAAQLANEIKDSPEYLAKACSHLNERLSQMYLALADSWIKKGNSEQATACLERIQRDFPGSTQAQLAQVKLKELQGKPSLQTDFKKQP